MDINTKTLLQQAAAITPLHTVNTGPSVDASVKSVADAGGKAESPVVSVGAATDAEAKNTKNSDNLKQAVSRLNNHVQAIQRNLQFSVDHGTMVVKIVDTQSNQVIQQIPSKDALRLAQDLTAEENKATFNIFNAKA